MEDFRKVVAKVLTEDVLNERRGRHHAGDETGEEDEGEDADKHIYVQMQKASGWKPTKEPVEKSTVPLAQHHTVSFDEGPHEVHAEHADKWLNRYEQLKPEGKLAMANFSQKSHHHFLRAINITPPEEQSSSMAVA